MRDVMPGVAFSQTVSRVCALNTRTVFPVSLGGPSVSPYVPPAPGHHALTLCCLVLGVGPSEPLGPEGLGFSSDGNLPDGPLLRVPGGVRLLVLTAASFSRDGCFTLDFHVAAFLLCLEAPDLRRGVCPTVTSIQLHLGHRVS